MPNYKLVPEDELTAPEPSATKYRVVDDGQPAAPTPPKSRGVVDDYARMFAAGATYDFADEMSAKVSEAAGSGTYEANVAEERARDEDIKNRRPVGSTVAMISGMLASPLTRLIGAGVNAMRAPGYVNLALQGGAGGALEGAGQATEGNRLEGAGFGGSLGFAFGAAMPALINAGAGAVRAGVNKFSAPATRAARKFDNALTRDGYAIGDVRGLLDDIGPGASLADLGGNVRGLAETVAQMPGKSLKAAEQLAERQYGQGERLMADALKIAKTDSAETLIKARSEAARPWYQAAFSQDNYRTLRSPLIERLMTRPDFQKGVRAGIKDVLDEAAITGEDVRYFNTFFEGANLDDPNLVLKKEPTLRILDAAKRGLDKMLNSDELINANGTKKQEWHRVNDMRAALLKEIDDKIGDTAEGKAYKKAREEWGGPSDVIDGLRLIEKTVESARDGSDLTGRLYGSPAARKKMSKFFKGDSDAEKQFRASVDREKTFAETNRQLSGNSRTGFRTAAKEDLADDSVDAVIDVAQNPTMGNALSKSFTAARNWLKRPPTEVADELTGIFETDPVMRAKVLEAYQKRVGGDSLLNSAMRPFPKSGNLLSGAARTGGVFGGYLGSGQ